MPLTIVLPEAIVAAVEARAYAEGITPDRFVSQVLENTLAANLKRHSPGQPLETGYGMLAKYGPAPSAEEIEQNRREMFGNFGQAF